MKAMGSIQLLGDYGSKTGLAKLTLPDMVVEDYSSQQTKLSAFAAALVAANLTGCAVGDLTTSQKSESLPTAPGDDVNVKEKLEYTWRTENDSRTRRGTIPGLPKTGAPLDPSQTGDVLNAAGKAALVAALNAAYGLTPGTDGAIVLQGKAVEDR